nr:uncharacterized protein LOC109184816 [Ipomoea batatas]
MTLREKVVELGFNKDDNLSFFTLGEKGLFEFMTNLETWNLVNNVVRPEVVEIWAILGVSGDYADVVGDADRDTDEEGEGVGGSSDGSDWEKGESANELEEFEGSEYENDKGDDQEFVKHVDPQAADALNLSDDGAEFQTTARPIPQLPSPLWLGRTFSKKVEFKDAVKAYAIQYGKELKFKKNDKVRRVAKCMQEAWRPKKLKKKSADESKRSETHLTRKLVTLHCSKCKQKGHNIRCPQLAHNARAVEGDAMVEQVVVEQVVAEQVVAKQVVAEQVMADLNVVAEQVMAEQVESNAQGGQREVVAKEIPVDTQPFEELTDDELLRLFDCPILGIPNIGFHYVRCQLQFEEMDNTSQQ